MMGEIARNDAEDRFDVDLMAAGCRLPSGGGWVTGDDPSTAEQLSAVYGFGHSDLVCLIDRMLAAGTLGRTELFMAAEELASLQV